MANVLLLQEVIHQSNQASPQAHGGPRPMSWIQNPVNDSILLCRRWKSSVRLEQKDESDTADKTFA